MIMIVINFAIQFGYYGLWLWFPELFNKLEIFHKAFPNNTINVCEVNTPRIHLKQPKIFHQAFPNNTINVCNV
jgi:hypothetical protein